jgi:hypothetical protein
MLLDSSTQIITVTGMRRRKSKQNFSNKQIDISKPFQLYTG